MSVLIKEKRYSLYPDLLDIHVERLVRANSVVLSYMKDTELLRSGLLRYENFLEDREKINEVVAQASQVSPADTKTFQSLIGKRRGSVCFDITEKKLWPVITGLFQNKAFDDVTRHFISHAYLQHLYNCPDDNDEQKVYHSDTFFHCVKFWYFPQEVNDGAFWYVPYSPIVTEDLVRWHEARVKDLKEGKVEAWRGPSHKDGSFRINLEELKELGLSPVEVTVKADTLVIANVFGFHRRGDTKKPTHRLSIHGSIRLNNPFAYCG